MTAEPTWSERWCGAGNEPPQEIVTTVRLLRARPGFVGAIAAGNFILLRLAQFPTRRFVLLLAVSALPLAVGVYNALQIQTPRHNRASLWRSLIASDIFGPLLVALTGGLLSPFVPFLLANVIIMVVLWRRRQAVRWLLAGLAVVLLGLFLAPSSITGPRIPSPYFEIMTALNLASALYFAAEIVLAVSEGFLSARRTLLTVRERMVESAVQRMRSLEQVGSKVAHELKNPLAAVKSLLQVEDQALGGAERGDPSGRPDVERSRRRLEVMAREVARMEAVLRDYLSFARPLEDLRIGSVDLAEVAESVSVLLEGRAAAAGIDLQRTGESVRTGGDARRLEEALLNIASNAIEATAAGGRVTITTERRHEGAAIVVTDTGKGMTAAIVDKLGTPFFTTRREGTGLGVVLARAALAQHGGRLDYESRPGEGTTATLALPDRMRTAGAIEEGMIYGPPPTS
jgi:signal transduction histidine kinase